MSKLGSTVLTCCLCLFSTMHRFGFAQTVNETSDLSVTNIRKALAGAHASIAARPKETEGYVDLAYALTDAGMGEQAWAAAAEATRATPTHALAFSAQGWVLRHNNIGVDFGSGFDYDGALRAYRKAIELKPGDLSARLSQANLLEFNREGIHYAPDAQLSLAIDAYRYVKQRQRPLQADLLSNLAINLFYAGRYDEAIAELAGMPGTEKTLGIFLASIAASQGSSAAVAMSNQIQGDEQRRKDALNFASVGLYSKRMYAPAADLLTASLPDTTRGPEVSAKIQIFSNLKPFVPSVLSASDPRSPVQELLEKAFTGTLDGPSVERLLSRHSHATDAAWSSAMKQSDAVAGGFFALMQKTKLPRAVVADIVLSGMSVTTSSVSKSGATVSVQVTGSAPQQFFVVSEDGTWKIAASGQGSDEVGVQALYLLSRDDAETARSILGWRYTIQDRSQEPDDPLSGDLFTRLWAPRMRTTTQAPLFAAAALTNHGDLLRPVIPAIVDARESAPVESRILLDQLLATAYLRLEDIPHSRALSSRLLAQYPESTTAIYLRGKSYALDHDWPAWKDLLTKRLQTEPDNRGLLLEMAAEAESERDYVRARQVYRHILDGAHGTSADSVMYAWLSLFEGTADNEALAAAQRASLNAGGHDYQALLTVACISAARGNTAEAHQELLDAMSTGNLARPNAGVWYGFGRIFEQYGVVDAALSAYQNAIKMADTGGTHGFGPGGASVLDLAQMRLKALAAK